jgi:CheY-like chemotaxis protein
MGSGADHGLQAPEGRRPRIAVVDGNAHRALVTSMLVEQFGGAPVPLASGEAALSLLRREPVDLVVMDLSVPDMDGVVAVQLIRALGERGSVPIIALVGNRWDGGTRRARSAGISGTLLKPYSPRELYGAMRAALARAEASVPGHA